MIGFIDTLLFSRENDTAEKQLDENRNNKLRDLRDLFSDEFKKYYKPSDMVLNYIELLLKADEGKNMIKRCEINSKLKFKILLLIVWKFMIEGDIFYFRPYHERIFII